jgi:KDO2-lipid IV(A) lauroyltransferase
MKHLVYWFFYAVSLLPFWALYLFSDMEYLVVYHIVRYRRKIVRRNLTSAFPEKDAQEIKDIEHQFYHWFCDYFFEAVKLLSISESELRRRFTVNNSAEVEQCFQEGQDVGAILGHYCNWEWLSCVGIDLPRERVIGLIYDPLHSEAFDYLFRRLRSSQPNAITVPKKNILRQLLTLRQEGRRSIFGYIADQAPKWQNIHLWLPFLHHETPVFTGAERIMRKMNNAVFYVEMDRPRRGYYSCTYRLITREPAKLPEYEVTRRFFALLEETIQRQPAYYLWSHDHWKRTHEEFDRRFEVVNGKVVERKKPITSSVAQ